MIKITIKYDDKIKSIHILGHAGYDSYGKDIVCASVSSIVITSINAIIRIDENAISYNDKDGLYIDVLKHDEVTYAIIDNMVSLLLELEKQYKENITINKEVCS